MSEEDLRRINPGQQGVGSIPRAGNGEFGVGAGNFRFPTEHLTTEDAEKLEKLMASDRDVAEVAAIYDVLFLLPTTGSDRFSTPIC
tara:strand:- start:192 stop:449 length:258 start_codon:yes stop_codon:yes gene_type:complete